ncbi:Rieske (2Fe-2S) protein [Hoyosella rhizosphaerae]|uniref:Cytochrome bc1 complex Rieske iron-sulfur subunit n=2 Tax=Hoyosella rhizosphaerae TaxID=1755582 RepID=A0A916X9E5_9ACTN|nr:Rieske (2Fe-2S) protein [Hoyosella rhizosphaerae]GGC54541.1 iron-sulfur protein [Hoyosella rhizosphaerae]
MDRRQAIKTACVLCAGTMVAGCGRTGSGADDVESLPPATFDPDGQAEENGFAIANVEDVPVGGGIVLFAEQVVITQPSEGNFFAFSAVCPHQGCMVQEPEDGRIVCPCHDSRFELDGSRIAGPATSGLRPRQISLNGTSIVLAQ